MGRIQLLEWIRLGLLGLVMLGLALLRIRWIRLGLLGLLGLWRRLVLLLRIITAGAAGVAGAVGAAGADTSVGAAAGHKSSSWWTVLGLSC